MTEFKRTQRDYPLSFKLAVVGPVEKGEMTYKQAQQRYGIQGRSTVFVWLRKYGRLDWSPGLPDQVKRTRPVTQTTVPLTPEQRIRELEEQLELANQKAELFDLIKFRRWSVLLISLSGYVTIVTSAYILKISVIKYLFDDY